MKGTRNLSLLIILGLVLILGVWGCSGYNGLVSTDQNVKKFGEMLRLITREELDLYSSVIKTVEASANFEKSLLKDVMEARAKLGATTVNVNDQASLDKYQQAQGK